MLLKDKVAVITGGTRGIGRAITEAFAQAGAKVAFSYLSSSAQAAELEQLYPSTKGFKSDASSFSGSEQFINDIIGIYGRVDVLVNNAGVTHDNLLLRMTEEHFDEVLEKNLKSVFNLTKHVSKHMLKQRSGSIINLSSVIGIRGQAGQANYAASKAGIIGFTKSVADEFGMRNIRCNAIAPGFIETDMTSVLSDEAKAGILKQIPMNRIGRAEEVANAALFLASDLSTYVNGQVIGVCGGMIR